MATVEMGRERRTQTRTTHEARGNRSGLKIETRFCPRDVANPFDTTAWEMRKAAIKDENGKVLFEQTNCEIPADWSQLATNVVVSKYFYGDPNNPKERENSVRQLIHRVTRTIADWGIADGYFDTPEDGECFYRDLTWLCLHQYGSFNSPVWFNVGLFHQYGVVGTKCNWRYNVEAGQLEQPENPYEFPQASACFIQSVGDNMEDIMRLATSEAMLFKFGSGTGTDLSTIRSSREKLSGGGKPSGPLSFMRVYDQIAAVVKSGGKTRRAAKMQSIKVWHPDIMEFIECKWKEEQTSTAKPTPRSCSKTPTSPSASPTSSWKRSAMTRCGRPVGSPTSAPSSRRPTRPAKSSTAWPIAHGIAVTQAFNTTRPSIRGTPVPTAVASTPATRAPSTCSWTTPLAIWPRST
jgi:ribonucleoside-diphosphate reductase alpha chain